MPESVAQDQSEGCLSEHSMAGQTRGKFANNEPWPQLHWSNSKTLSYTCPIKSLKNSWRRVNRHGTDRLKPTPKPGNWINWRKKRCAIIAKGSASGSRETRFDTQPKIFRHVSTFAARHKSESEGSYRLFVADPASVKFKAIKRLADGNQLCSARVTRDYRVLGVLVNDIVIWFWIGSHNNYERLIKELR